MKDISTKRIKNISSEEQYKGENELILNTISELESMSCAELVRLLDETCIEKRKLPWEYRRAFRIKDLTEEERKLYYMHYSEERLNEGNKQLELLKKVLSRLKYKSQKQVTLAMELGTGRGGFLAALQQSLLFPNAQFQGIDTDIASLLINQKINDDLGNENYSLICYSGDKLPFDDQSIDIITSFSTLEHVGNIEKQYHLLAECSRCLKPQGIAILRFPNKYNIIKPEEHVKILFLHFLPRNYKDLVSFKIAGMPSSDIHPPSIFQLRKVLKKISDIAYKLYSEAEFENKKLKSSLFRSYIAKTIGPGFVLVIIKT